MRDGIVGWLSVTNGILLCDSCSEDSGKERPIHAVINPGFVCGKCEKIIK